MKPICLLVLSILATAAGPASADSAKDKEKLQGTWVLVSLVDSGRPEPPEEVKQCNLTFKGDQYIYMVDTRTATGTFTIDPEKQPKEMTVTFPEGPFKGTMQAIYSLEGNELKICAADKRPAEFTSKPKSQTVLMVWKREKR